MPMHDSIFEKLTRNANVTGAQPRVWAQQKNKQEFNLRNEDIEGAGCRMLHIGLNKPEYNLTNEDIAGTKTQIVKFTTTREPSNPLNPVYKLPSFTYVAPPVPKFIRDGMIIDDIEGTRPLQKREFAPRETNKIDDIYGATKKRPYIRIKTGETAFDNLSYNDVTRKSWTSKRMTNPLNPTYTVWD